MSLNDWSLLYCASISIYMFAMFFSLFTNLTVAKVIFVILAWITHIGVTLTYGISTSQIGFIFLFGLEIIMTMLMFIQFGRLDNEDSES